MAVSKSDKAENLAAQGGRQLTLKSHQKGVVVVQTFFSSLRGQESTCGIRQTVRPESTRIQECNVYLRPRC